MAKERDDLRALNEQVMRNQAALRQQNTALQEERGLLTAQTQDLREQVLTSTACWKEVVCSVRTAAPYSAWQKAEAGMQAQSCMQPTCGGQRK